MATTAGCRKRKEHREDGGERREEEDGEKIRGRVMQVSFG